MITILSVSVHNENEDPIFGKGSNVISLVSEGGGMFIEIEQDTSSMSQAGKAQFDFLEFDKIIEAVKMLRSQPAVK